MKRLIILFVLLALALASHVFFMSWPFFQKGRPDFLLLLVIFWSWRWGGKEGMIVGFVTGLVIDLLFSPLLGLYSFSFSFIGFLIVEIKERVYQENILFFLLIVAGVSLLSRVIISTWLEAFGISSFLTHLPLTLFPAPLYNCLLAFFILLLKEGWAIKKSGRSS